MDDILVGFRVALPVHHIPAQRFKEGIDKFAAHLRLVVLAGTVGGKVPLKSFDKFLDAIRGWHESFLTKYRGRRYKRLKFQKSGHPGAFPFPAPKSLKLDY
ncbi:MAG: hypothetical protein RRC34_14120 [Lentisphaeria bacterium]|nr:hypothetical protein [Lentisphaeria bacterium]